MLAPGEMYPASRSADDEISGTPMEGVEHLGQYVFEMTQAKLKAIGEEGVVVESMDVAPDGDELDVDAGEGVDEDEVMGGAGGVGAGEVGAGEAGANQGPAPGPEEEDPLHEHVMSSSA